MPDQDGLRFLFEIQDKITADLIKIEKKAVASAKNIDKAFSKASQAQQANAAKVIHTSKLRSIAVENATAKATAARTKETKQGQILAQRLASAQSTEARRAENFRVASAKRVAAAATKTEKAIAASAKAQAKAQRDLKRQSEATTRSVTRLASASAVAFGAVAGKALVMAGGYDKAMRSVQAKTQASGELMDRLSEQSREMGRTTVHSATEAARGQAFLAQAGFDANAILEALPATLALATAGELDLASAADIASNVLSGFQLETKETGRVADVLALAASKTNTSVLQLGSALAKAAPAAKAAGWSLEETTAAIGKLSDAGIQGEEAGTTLNTMLAKLSINGGPAEKLLAKMGITVKDTSGNMLPLNDILSALAPHASDVGLQMELLGTRGAKAGFILGAVAQDARELTGELENAEGSAQSMADVMSGGLWGSLKQIGSIVDSAFISLGQRLAPALQKVADLFAKLPSPIQEVVVVVGSLVGAMGGLMLLMPQSFGALVQLPGKLIKLAKGLKLVTAAQWLYNTALTANPIGLVVAAVALLAGGLYLLWKRYKSVQEEFDASAASTEDLTDRYDELTEKVAAATAKLERAQETNSRALPTAAKTLRALVAQRDELDLHIQQRAETEKAAKKLAATEKKATKILKKATEEQLKAEKAAEDTAKAVQGLVDSWTGATLKSGEFLKAFKKLTPAQRDNDRIMGQVIGKYESMRKVLGPFDDELEELWKTNQILNEKLEAEEKALKEATKAQEDATKAADALNARLEAQRLRLLGLPTAAAIQDFEELTQTWEDLSEAEKTVATPKFAQALIDASKAGFELNDAQVELIDSSGVLTKEQEKLKQEAEELNDRLEKQRRRLLNLPTEAAIQSFAELTQTWEGLNEAEREVATKEYSAALHEAAQAGHTLDAAQIAIIESTQEATASASGYELALAGIASGMGGATGQALNLIIAMREHNKEQKKAAALGKKTEGSFGKMRTGAAGLATAFSAVGDMVGGTAGKVMKELSGIAKAFATGGLVAGIIAGIMALGKAIWGLFTRGRKKRAAARKKEAAAAKKVADAAKEAADTHAEAVENLRLAWLNLPTEQIVLDLAAIREAWDALVLEDRTVAFDDYVASLISARDAGAELTAAELNLITVFEEHQGKRTAMLARHKAEMSGFESQIAALESLLQTKISEVDALISQQKAELDALSALQDAEMEALAARRQAALDVIKDTQAEQLSILKESQRKELDALKATQAAELSAIKAARAASLGVIEAAIQRELEDERIAAQLRIDLRKAGGDQEAIDAAHARAATATERLLERDELDGMMAEAEERVRARYQDELDTVTAHWDALEALTGVRHQAQLTELEETHSTELTALEDSNTAELAAHNAYFDALEELMALRHADELAALEAAHKLQLEALLSSLVERRDALRDSQAVELKDLDDFYDAKVRTILAGQVKERDARSNAERDTQSSDGTYHEHSDMPAAIQHLHNPIHPYDDPSHHFSVGLSQRQHGGPVSAGRPYIVGEAGPEMFVPSGSGRIEPNSSSGATVDPRILARAIKDALQDTSVQVDGRRLGRLTIRHQPIAVTELGGRR